MRVLRKMFGRNYAWLLLRVIIQQCIIRTSIPILLGFIIGYMENQIATSAGYICIVLFVIFAFLSSILLQTGRYDFQHMELRIRVGLTSLIFAKALKLSQGSLAASGVGQLTNLISNDLNRFEQSMQNTPFIIAGPVQIVLVTVVLFMYTGVSCIPGILLPILFLPCQVFIGRIFGKLRTEIAKRTDKRIRQIAEVVTGILLVKMSAWEEPYEDILKEARGEEVKHIKRRTRLYAFNMSLFAVVPKASVLVTFMTYVLTGHTLTVESVFVTLAMHNTLSATTGIFLPMGLSSFAEILVSIRRIQVFLLSDEKSNQKSLQLPEQLIEQKIELQVRNLTCSWSRIGSESLANISLDAKSGELIAIIGPVGSGKSTLLQAILGELPAKSGIVSHKGSIAYASQDPWLFRGSVRDNILFGKQYDQSWYDQVIEACSLTHDLRTLQFRDNTPVGEKGSMLSGGQQARVNLARAVYSNSDIYLLDDPLSAVDVRVARHLVDKCIRGILRTKCVILVTHQTQYLEVANTIISMDNGKIVCSGPYTEVLMKSEGGTKHRKQSDAEGVLTIDDISFEDEEQAKAPKIDTSTKEYGTFTKAPVLADEKKGQGRIELMLYFKYLRSGNSWLILAAMFLLITSTQILLNGSDFWLKLWTDIEILQTNDNSSNTVMIPENSDSHHLLYLVIYAAIVLLIFISSNLMNQTIFGNLVSSSAFLHNQMLASILRAPMTFFESSTSGRILNRFSNDTGNLDEMLPQITFISIISFTQTIGDIIVVIIMIPYLCIATAIQFLALFFIQKLYGKASPDIKRLEGMARSPVFEQLATTLSGLPVIRAFGAQEFFHNQYIHHQDVHSSNYFMYITTVIWMSLTVEMLADLYITAVLIALLCTSTPSALGLAVSAALTQTLYMATFMYYTNEVLNQFVAAERIMEYAQLEPEAAHQPCTLMIDPKWPYLGNIRLDNVSIMYKNGPTVLRNITLDVRQGEKIGIIGRTGAGKTSLVSALFRILEPKTGEIHIDYVNIARVGLKDLRMKLSIIPQNPVLFSGTVRRNLDPFNIFRDSELLEALESVQLTGRIRESSSASTLQTEVSEGGSNFSQGERQLLCLARTILTNNKVLILDEPTANVDTRTSGIVQAAIRSRFTNSTVLTIAHRLDTVMDNDKILVLHNGCLQEFAEPISLLENKGSYLSKLVEKTGKVNAQKLRTIAEEAHLLRKRVSNSFNLI